MHECMARRRTSATASSTSYFTTTTSSTSTATTSAVVCHPAGFWSLISEGSKPLDLTQVTPVNVVSSPERKQPSTR